MDPISLVAIAGASGVAVGALMTRLMSSTTPPPLPSVPSSAIARERELQDELQTLRPLVSGLCYLPVQAGSLSSTLDRAMEVLAACYSHKSVDAAALFTSDGLLMASAQGTDAAVDAVLGQMAVRVLSSDALGTWRRVEMESSLGRRLTALKLHWNQGQQVLLLLRTRGVGVPDAMLQQIRYMVEGVTRESRQVPDAVRVQSGSGVPTTVDRFVRENPVTYLQLTRGSVRLLDLGMADVQQQRALDRLWQACLTVQDEGTAVTPALLRVETADQTVHMTAFVHDEDGMQVRLRVGAQAQQAPAALKVQTLASQLRWQVEQDGGKGMTASVSAVGVSDV